MARQALAILTCSARFGQFCMFILLFSLAQVDMQSDMVLGEEASRQPASLLQAAVQAIRKFPELLLLLPHPCDVTTMVVSARAITVPPMHPILRSMIDPLLVETKPQRSTTPVGPLRR
jgi:hypothetical protein